MGRRPVAYIDQSACDGCSSCAVGRICPNNAVVPDPAASPPTKSGGHATSLLHGLMGRHEDRTWRVEESKCAGCLLCAPYCPHQAVVARDRGKAA